MSFALYRLFLWGSVVPLAVFVALLAYTLSEGAAAYLLLKAFPGSELAAWLVVLIRGAVGGAVYTFTAFYVAPSRSARSVSAVTAAGVLIGLYIALRLGQSDRPGEAGSLIVAALACGAIGAWRWARAR